MSKETVRHELCKVPLVDLGAVENTAFAGVLSPEPELGLAREGVNEMFPKDAES